MDAETLLLQAVTALGATTLDESVRLAIGEAWQRLKRTVVSRFGEADERVKTLEALEALPRDAMPSEDLRKNVQALAFGSDPQVADALAQLDELIRVRVPQNVFQARNLFYQSTFHNTTFN